MSRRTTHSSVFASSIVRRGRHILGLIAKRLCDVTIALAALIILSPAFALIAALIKIDSSGPTFYRGVRVGLLGEPFRMFKFRTMVAEADRMGGPSTAADDARLTQVGRFLRRYKLDELPQLINVLKGEMSLVGPRPEVPHYVSMYTPEERRLLMVKPGITDYASLRFSNEAEILRGAPDPEIAYMKLIRPEKIRLGLRYVETRSMIVDLKILARTLVSLLKR